MNLADNLVKYLPGSSLLWIQSAQKEYQKAQNINIDNKNDYFIEYDALQQKIIDFFESEQKNLLSSSLNQNASYFQQVQNQSYLAQVQYVLHNYEPSLGEYQKKIDEQQVYYDQNALKYNQGITFLQLKKFEEAMECFDSIINSQGAQENLAEAAINAKGIAYIKQGEFKQASNTIFSYRYVNSQSLYLKIFLMIREQQYQKAIDFFQNSQRDIENDSIVFAQTLNEIGIAHINLNQINEAISYFERAIKIDSNEFIYKNNLILSKLKTQQDNVYQDCLNIALSCKEQEGKQNIDVYFLCGKLFYKLNKNQEALEHFQFAYKLLENSPIKYEITSKQYQEFDQNIVFIEKIKIKLYILLTYYSNYTQSNNDDAKQQYFNNSIETFNQAVRILSKENQKQNIQYFEHYFYSLISLLQLDMENYQDAALNIEKAIRQIQSISNQNENLQENVQIYYLIAGYANLQLNNYNQSLRCFNNVDKSEYQQLKIYYQSEIYIKQQDYASAIQNIEQIQTEDDQLSIRKKILLGIVFIMTNDMEKAWNILVPLKKILLTQKQQYNQLVKDSKFRYYLSLLYFKQNMFNKALKMFEEESLQENNNCRRYMTLLASCYAQVGEDEKAYQLFKKIFESIQDPNNEQNKNSEDFEALLFFADFLFQQLKKDQPAEIKCEQLYQLAAKLNQESYYYEGIYLSQMDKLQDSSQCFKNYQQLSQSSSRSIIIQHIIALNYYYSLDYKSLDQTIYQSPNFGFKNFLDLHNYYTNSTDSLLYRKLFVLFDLIKKKYHQDGPFLLYNIIIEKRQNIDIVLNEFEYVYQIFQLFKQKKNQLSIVVEQEISDLSSQHDQQKNEHAQINNILDFMFKVKINLAEIYIQFLMNIFPYRHIHQIFTYYQSLNTILLKNQGSNENIIEKNSCCIMLCIRILETLQLLYKLKIPNLKYQWIKVLLSYNFWVQDNKKANITQNLKNKKGIYSFLNIISNCLDRDIYSIISFLQNFIESDNINPTQTLKDFCSSATQSTYQQSYCQRFMSYLQIELFSYSQIQSKNQAQDINLADKIVKKLASTYIKYEVNINLNLKQNFKNKLNYILQKLNIDLQLNENTSEYINSSFHNFLIEISEVSMQNTINDIYERRQQIDQEYFESYFQAESQFLKQNQMNEWREVYISYLFKNRKLFINTQNMIRHQSTNQNIQQLIYSILITQININQQKERFYKFIDLILKDSELNSISKFFSLIQFINKKYNFNLFKFFLKIINQNKIIQKQILSLISCYLQFYSAQFSFYLIIKVSVKSPFDPKVFKSLLNQYETKDIGFAKLQFEKQFEIIYKYRFKHTDEEKVQNIYSQVMEKLNNSNN